MKRLSSSQTPSTLVVNDAPVIFALPLLLAALLVGAGCRPKADQARGAADPDADVERYRRESRWTETPLEFEQKAVAVAAGETPLVHLFDIGGPIRIVEQSSGAKLVSVTVPNRTLVRIDDRNGVTVGPDNLVRGPLPGGRKYVIFLDPSTPNVVRQGIGPPAAPPRAPRPQPTTTLVPPTTRP